MAYIVKPLVTEKMTAISEKQNNKFGFIVLPAANKIATNSMAIVHIDILFFISLVFILSTFTL